MNLVNLETMQKHINLVIEENLVFQLYQVLLIIILMAQSNLLIHQLQFTTSKIDLKDLIQKLTRKMDPVPTMMVASLEMILNHTLSVYVVRFQFLQDLDQQTIIQMDQSN
jgi:hypothetical protein